MPEGRRAQFRGLACMLAGAAATPEHYDMTPDWLEPMAATLTQDRFNDPAWLFERKLDGIRIIAYGTGDDVRLLTRNRLPRDLPQIAQAIRRLPVEEVILDGESTWEPDVGFAYHVFDILWLNGESVTELPLTERHALLDALPLESPIFRVQRLHGERPWEDACREGWEGVIAKRVDSMYEHRRSKNWLKMKCELTRQLVIGGFTDPQKSRVGLGALLVGYHDGDDFVFAGKVGTGLDTRQLLSLRERLDAIEIAQPPFTKAVGLPRAGVHWVKPEVTVNVAFLEWTDNGKMRHPRLLNGP